MFTRKPFTLQDLDNETGALNSSTLDAVSYKHVSSSWPWEVKHNVDTQNLFPNHSSAFDKFPVLNELIQEKHLYQLTLRLNQS